MRCHFAFAFAVCALPAFAQAPMQPPVRPLPEDPMQQDAQYGGPAILSRGEAPSTHGRQAIPFRVFATATGYYEDALTPVAASPEGTPISDHSIGTSLGFGAYTYHRWRKAQLGLNYSGNLQHSFTASRQDNSNHYLTLQYAHQLASRITLSTWLGGLYSNRAIGINPTLFFDPSVLPDSGVDLFDTRTGMVNAGVRATYQKSVRLSFSAAASESIAKRFSNSLYSSRGTAASGDISYRLSRFTTTGLTYSFTHLAFPRSFGGSDIHTLAIFLAVRLSRSWEMSAAVGANRIETLLSRRVPLDPVVALLTGERTGVQAFYGVTYSSLIDARLSRSFRHAIAALSYRQGVTPGNGFMLTSQQQMADAMYSYTGIRKWNFGLNATAGKLRALTQTVSTTRYGAGLGLTRQLFSTAFHGIFRANLRRYELPNFRRDAYRLEIGLAWSPGETPIALW